MGAKTIALDETKHQLYIPVADMTTPAATEGTPNPKPVVAPNTFGVLVIGKQ